MQEVQGLRPPERPSHIHRAAPRLKPSHHHHSQGQNLGSSSQFLMTSTSCQATNQCCGSRMLSRIRIFSHSGSQIQGQKDSRIRIRIKEFKYFNPKIVSKLSEIWFVPDPELYFLPIPYPGRKKGTGSWIPDMDPQH